MNWKTTKTAILKPTLSRPTIAATNSASHATAVGSPYS